MRRWILGILGVSALGCSGIAVASRSVVQEEAQKAGFAPALAARMGAFDAEVRAPHRSPAAVCRLVAEASALGAAVGRDPAFTLSDPVVALDEALSGLALQERDGLDPHPSWKDLAADADPASAALLAAVDAYYPDGGEVAAGVEVADSAGCFRPGNAAPALRALAAAWPGAPDCLRDAVRPGIQASLEQLQTASCYCAADASAVRAELAAVRPAMEALRAAGGPSARAPSLGSDSSFGGSCGG